MWIEPCLLQCLVFPITYLTCITFNPTAASEDPSLSLGFVCVGNLTFNKCGPSGYIHNAAFISSDLFIMNIYCPI